MAIDLWLTRTLDAAGADVRDACLALLAPAERAMHASFALERHRWEYLATRALCRTVLARYVGGSPAALVFRHTRHGRPELDPPADLRFNLANTPALVACAVSLAGEIGVDAEPLERADDVLDVAATVFTPREQSALSGLGARERRTRAVQLWTCKEAYVKARGLGLSLPVLGFELALEGPAPRLRFLADLHDDPARWDLSTRVVDGHVIATCAERTTPAPAGVAVRPVNLRRLLAGAPSC